MTTAYHHDYPYRLRLQHPEYAELRVERRGRFVRVDPAEAPTEDDIVVLTSPAPHRSRATVEALRAGKRLTVVASAPVFEWLAKEGAVGGPFPQTIDGLTIDGLPYSPPKQARPLGHFLRASIAGARPGAALRRMADTSPSADPSAVQITFEDGSRLVHLDLALHGETDAAWLDRAAARFGGAEWLLLGFAWGEGDAVVRHAGRFGARRVLVAELVNAERREMGLPTELVTPVRDKLVASGVEAHVFATQASFRFE